MIIIFIYLYLNVLIQLKNDCLYENKEGRKGNFFVINGFANSFIDFIVISIFGI